MATEKLPSDDMDHKIGSSNGAVSNFKDQSQGKTPPKRKTLVKKVRRNGKSLSKSSMSMNRDVSNTIVRDSISIMVADHDQRRNGSSGFILPRYSESN